MFYLSLMASEKLRFASVFDSVFELKFIREIKLSDNRFFFLLFLCLFFKAWVVLSNISKFYCN